MKISILKVLLLATVLCQCARAQTEPAAQPNNAAATTEPQPQPNPATVPDQAQSPAAQTQPAAAPETKSVDRNLRLNFRGVPLEMVLNYLSEAAGFVILPGQVDVKGKVDVWSNQPLSKDEAVQLLNTILSQNGYTAIQKGRTLQIVNNKDARTQDLPVHSGNDPQNIPKTDQMVTQVIPIRYISAAQIIKDLEPLMTDYAKMTANESGNALVLTDTQSHIRRMTEIIRALDLFSRCHQHQGLSLAIRRRQGTRQCNQRFVRARSNE